MTRDAALIASLSVGAMLSGPVSKTEDCPDGFYVPVSVAGGGRLAEVEDRPVQQFVQRAAQRRLDRLQILRGEVGETRAKAEQLVHADTLYVPLQCSNRLANLLVPQPDGAALNFLLN